MSFKDRRPRPGEAFYRRESADPGINLIKPKIGGWPDPLRPVELWQLPGRVRDAVATDISRIRSLNYEPWFINIDADWWDQARRDDDLRTPTTRPLPDGNWTFYGLPVLVWAPGSPQSRGFTIHVYPPTWPRRR